MITDYYTFITESSSDHNPYLSYIDCVSDPDVKEALKDNDPARHNNKAIIWFARKPSNDHLGLFNTLLKDPRVDPSVNNNEPIRWAMLRGKVDMVKSLLEDPRVDPTAHDNNGIIWAHRASHEEILKIVFNHLYDDHLLISLEEIRDIIEKNMNDNKSEIDTIISRRNQGELAKQQVLDEEDDLLDLF